MDLSHNNVTTAADWLLTHATEEIARQEVLKQERAARRKVHQHHTHPVSLATHTRKPRAIVYQQKRAEREARRKAHEAAKEQAAEDDGSAAKEAAAQVIRDVQEQAAADAAEALATQFVVVDRAPKTQHDWAASLLAAMVELSLEYSPFSAGKESSGADL